MSNIYDDLTNLYPLSKTLRFELKPIGKTKDYIEERGLITEDEERFGKYGEIKKMIDEYHKDFINESLKNTKLSYLKEYMELFNKNKKDDDEKKKLLSIEQALRNEVADQFTKQEKYKGLFGKEIITKYLPEYLKHLNNDKVKMVKEFSSFTTYFKGFAENRKNMYSNEAKTTAISYRVINENLPVFILNINTYIRIKKVLNDKLFSKMQKDLELYLQVPNIDEMFEIDYYNDCLTQVGITLYNNVIGGYSDASNKYKGINEYINEYNQTVPKNERIPKLRQLYKQILSDRESLSFALEKYKNDQEVLDSIKFYRNSFNSILDKIKELFENIAIYDLDKAYIKNDLSITTISKQLYSNWNFINLALQYWYDTKLYTGNQNTNTTTYENKRSAYLKEQSYFSISFLNQCLKEYIVENDVENKYVSIEEYFRSGTELLNNMEIDCEALNALINTEYSHSKNLVADSENITQIKKYLDCIMNIQNMVKPLLITTLQLEKDERLSEDLIYIWNVLHEVTDLYNKIRNYLTQKPYSQDKVKLNFNISTLLDGWDVNKEKTNLGIILIKDNLYYLGIMNSKNKPSFKNTTKLDSSYYEKIDYKLLPGANKMLPKVFFSKKGIKTFNPPNELIEKYKQGLHKKGSNFDISFCHELIDFFKKSIPEYSDWKNFGFRFKETHLYNDISEFYHEVEDQGYMLSKRRILEKDIDQLVEEGKLYLFQIYNKDFSKNSKGKPNLHTMYWKELFTEENLKKTVYKLNGQAEIFYRKSSIKIDDTPIHKKNVPLDNKNPLNPNKTSTFTYDIVKNKRYTEDKFLFHVPITINFINKNKPRINELVNYNIKYANIEDIKIIGIDRGERHLLYYTIIDGAGNIIEQNSLNTISTMVNGQKCTTEYHELLQMKEDERKKARTEWMTIENIKELKEGYLSQVIHKITDLMIKYNAIIVLEDLNFGFMRGRQKVEKQVYQKFEKMLIDKLNYLTQKDISNELPGGLLNAYQLTNQFESFEKLGKQSGVLFYIPAWNTSKMDPVTGFVNLFYIKYENMEKTKEFINKFDSIIFNEEQNYFEFKFDYNNFTDKAKGTKTNWTICSNGERIETFRNPDKNNCWDNKKIILTNSFIELMQKFSIDYKNGNILKEIIKVKDPTFFKQFTYLLKLTLQMRNSITGSDEDYLISPVRNEAGDFFDTRDSNNTLPQNADANGAYNIARKGLWAINQIKQLPDNQLGKPKLAISNKEWLDFIQNL